MLRLFALSSAAVAAAGDASLRGLAGAPELPAVQGANTSYRCVFVHGIGVGVTKPTSHEDEQEYWGGTATIAKYTPYCDERLFLQQDTLSRGWDDPSLHRAFCDAAVRPEEKDNVIRETVVISHSMGNLMVAEAIFREICTFDRTSSKWVSLSAPWGGSQVVPWLFNVCSDQPTSKLIRWLAGKLGYCDPKNPGYPHEGYDSLRPDYPGIKSGRLTLVAHAHVSHAICGNSAYGLTSYLSAALEALAAAVGFTDPNDGMVGIDSCILPDMTYGKSYKDTTFYLASINHADSTCRNGNGAFGKDSRQPCRWLRDIFGTPPGLELEESPEAEEEAPLAGEPTMEQLEGVFWVREGNDAAPVVPIATPAPAETEIVV